ncbi:MAG: 30S ribosomal protein S16 [Longimicrobiales bacterium]
MSVKIRLRRVGRKHQPSYRIVVARSADPRGGEYLDTVGFYNPRTQPAELRLDLGKVDQWLTQGAELSDTAASLIRKARKGGDPSVQLRDMKAESLKAAAPSATPKKRAARKKAGAAEGEAPAE